jgi:hypothetical protein
MPSDQFPQPEGAVLNSLTINKYFYLELVRYILDKACQELPQNWMTRT